MFSLAVNTGIIVDTRLHFYFAYSCHMFKILTFLIIPLKKIREFGFFCSICCFIVFFCHTAKCINERSSPELLLTASPPSYLFLNSRLHLVMASLPPVVMAEEQEVNQRSIISQPAPGGKSASHVTTPSLVGPLPACEPLTLQRPAASLWAVASVLSLFQVTCDTALMSQCQPSCNGTYVRLCGTYWTRHKSRKQQQNRRLTFCDLFVLPQKSCIYFSNFCCRGGSWGFGDIIAPRGQAKQRHEASAESHRSSKPTHSHLKICWHILRNWVDSIFVEEGSRFVLVSSFLSKSLRSWQMFLLKSELLAVAGNH